MAIKMRWVSDRQSAENSEITVLAISESVVYGILAYLIYRWTDTMWHLATAACFAPFLLLAPTDQSHCLLGYLRQHMNQLPEMSYTVLFSTSTELLLLIHLLYLMAKLVN
jgi:hypothetical protein